MGVTMKAFTTVVLNAYFTAVAWAHSQKPLMYYTMMLARPIHRNQLDLAI